MGWDKLSFPKIRLQELADNLKSTQTLPGTGIRIVHKILFDNPVEGPIRADAVLVLGNPTCLEKRVDVRCKKERSPYGEELLTEYTETLGA